jgi:hypothetical protein
VKGPRFLIVVRIETCRAPWRLVTAMVLLAMASAA